MDALFVTWGSILICLLNLRLAVWLFESLTQLNFYNFNLNKCCISCSVEFEATTFCCAHLDLNGWIISLSFSLILLIFSPIHYCSSFAKLKLPHLCGNPLMLFEISWWIRLIKQFSSLATTIIKKYCPCFMQTQKLLCKQKKKKRCDAKYLSVFYSVVLC